MSEEKQYGLGTANPQAKPIVDSPWFWAALFSAVALAALMAMSGKYGRRQANIEQKYQAREQVRWSEGGGGQTPRNNLEYSQPGATFIPLWPLSILLGSVIVVSVVMLIRSRKSNRRNTENAAIPAE